MTIAAQLATHAMSNVMNATTSAMLARVVVYDNLADAEPFWRRLQCPLQYSTFYQQFDFLAAWQAHVGTANGCRPCIVVGFDAADEPVIVMPLVIERVAGATVACFMGGKHANFNMPLYRRDFAIAATKAELMQVLQALQHHGAGVDAVAFTQQPMSWHGLPNPFSLLPRQRSVNPYPRLTIPSHAKATAVSNSMRRRIKGKERKLQSLPGYRHVVATDDKDIRRLIDFFFRLKPQHMAAQKIPNVFAEPGVEQFVRACCEVHGPDGKPMLQFHALECDDEVIALFVGMSDGTRYSMMFNTYTMSANARHSPGLILIRRIIDYCVERNVLTVDLGIGDADYKRMFCKEQDPVFDTFVALNSRGVLTTAMLRLRGLVLRTVKQSPLLLRMAIAARRLFT